MVLPVIAFAHPRTEDGMALTFLDHVLLSNAIQAISDLRVLSISVLNVPLGQVDLGNLSPHERREIVAWNAHTVGEVLFNFWD